MPNPSIKRRFRSFDNTVDPEKKQKLEGEDKNLSSENLPVPVVMSLPVIPQSNGPQKKLTFNFKNKGSN
jgi:hypothetical protein